MRITGYKNHFYSAAIFCLVATCFFIPVATAPLSLFSGLTILFWLLSGRAGNLPVVIRSNAVVFLVVLLFFLFLVGLAYSSADISESLSILKKYRELLLLPIAVSLLHGNPQAANRCVNAFLAGCITIMLISYGMYFSLIPTAKYGYSILYHITHSFFMSFLAFAAVHKLMDAGAAKVRFFWGGVLLLSIINMFYIGTGRTGLLIFIFLMLLFLLQRLSLLKKCLGIFLLLLLVLIAFKTSDTFRDRTSAAWNEVQQYEYGASRTSQGMRLDWWVDSLLMLKEKPVFGYGTGSFYKEHTAFISGTEIMETDNPHNEFLLIAVQLGTVGLAVFIMIFLAQLLCSAKCPPPDRFLVQGIVIAMAAGCTTNSFLFDSHQGHFWALLSAVYISSSLPCTLPAVRHPLAKALQKQQGKTTMAAADR